ncbi:MAG: hypothetical protein WCC77_25030 [Pseudolabrys sp.]
MNWQRDVLLQTSKHYQDQIAWWKDLFLGEPHPLDLPFQRAEPVANINLMKAVFGGASRLTSRGA